MCQFIYFVQVFLSRHSYFRHSVEDFSQWRSALHWRTLEEATLVQLWTGVYRRIFLRPKSQNSLKKSEQSLKSGSILCLFSSSGSEILQLSCIFIQVSGFSFLSRSKVFSVFATLLSTNGPQYHYPQYHHTHRGLCCGRFASFIQTVTHVLWSESSQFIFS